MFAWHDRDTTAAAASVFRKGFLDDEMLNVVMARNADAFDASIRNFMWAAGFDRYSLIVMHDDFSSPTSGVVLTGLNNTPPEFLCEWGDIEGGRADPVMQQCKHTTAPIVYGQEAYVEAGAGAKWERQAPFGYANGIVSTFHLPGNLHVSFGFDRVQRLPASPTELATIVARNHLFGTFVQAAALSLLNIEPHSARPSIRLSPREHECLQWAAEGKTAWETGMILSIAEGSVVKILASAIRKLDCANKPQAVVKALRLGLIH